jgi:hypothetical protein
MLLVLTKPEIIKVVRLCLTETNLENMSSFGIVIDYPTKEYSFIKSGMFAPSQVDILMNMLQTDKRVYFVDEGNEYDLILENVERNLKGYEAVSAVTNLLAGRFTEEDCMIVLQYIIYGRYKYPAWSV